MKILVVIDHPYFRRSGGIAYIREAYRGLREHGCEVLAIHTSAAYGVGAEIPAEHPSDEWFASEGGENVDSSVGPGKEARFIHNGGPVIQMCNAARLLSRLGDIVGEFEPDFVVVSSHGSEEIFARCFELAPDKVVMTSHASIFLPWERGFAETLQRCRGVWTSSQYLADHLHEKAGVSPSVVQLPMFEADKAPILGGRDKLVLAINPGLWKGFPVVKGLALDNPSVKFGAVCTWSVSDELNRELLELPNMEQIDPQPRERIDEIYARASVLLVPSLIPEGFGLVIIEAMLRGIPVLASDLGGCPEAKLGVPYVLPVNPVDLQSDAIPVQDLGPWNEALRALLDDQEHYDDIARRSRSAALKWAEGLSDSTLTNFFRSL